jgi:serine/threonine protein kinase
MEIAPGTVIQGYTFHELIGSGAFARVYRAFSARFGREFAAKVFLDDPGPSRQTFDAEMQSLMQLNHPNIIRLYDRIYHNGAVILILELCPRGTLEAEIVATRGRGLEIDRFISIARQLVEALDVCHAMGVAHRDIKPLNILFDEYDRPKLADFGVARLGEAGGSDGIVGTAAYLAPEIWRGDPIEPFKADIWALGVTFASMLNGGLPWPGVPSPNTQRGIREIGMAVCSGGYKIERNLPPIVDRLIESLLRVDPAHRLTPAELKVYPLFTASRVQLADSRNAPLRVQSIQRNASHDSLPRAQGWTPPMRMRPGTRRRVRLASCLPSHPPRLS